MATDAGELIVKISADVSEMKSALKQLSEGINQVGADTITKGNLMADAFKEVGRMAVQFAQDSIKAFAQQEATMTKLAFAVGSTTASSFGELAEQMQKTTIYSDSEILSLEAQLVTFGLTTNQIKQATRALIDYSSYTGKSLPEAGHALGQALAGNGRGFRELQLEIFQTDTRSERFTKTVGALDERFNGMSARLRSTTSGAIAGLGNNFEQLQQEVGKFLAEPGVGFTNWISKFVEHLTDSIRIITDFTKDVGGMGTVFKSVFLEMGRDVLNFLSVYVSKLSALGPILKLIGIDIQAINKKLNEKIDLLQKDTQTHTRSVIATVEGEHKKVAAINETTRAIDEYISQLEHSILVAQAVHTKITEITHMELEKRMLETQNSFETNASYSDQLRLKLSEDIAHNTAAWVDMTSSMINSFAQSTARMIVEGGRFSDVMKNLWRELAEQVIAQIIRMIAEWLVFQAMTGGAGGMFGGFMAEGGMINEPSVIVGLKSGRKHIAGEAGPEMVMPTGSGGGNYAFSGAGAGTKGGGGGSGGGGNVTINISGQFLEGSSSKWQRMIQEQIAPQIRRLAMKDPNSLITRKRGSLS